MRCLYCSGVSPEEKKHPESRVSLTDLVHSLSSTTAARAPVPRTQQTSCSSRSRAALMEWHLALSHPSSTRQSWQTWINSSHSTGETLGKVKPQWMPLIWDYQISSNLLLEQTRHLSEHFFSKNLHHYSVFSCFESTMQPTGYHIKRAVSSKPGKGGCDNLFKGVLY